MNSLSAAVALSLLLGCGNFLGAVEREFGANIGSVPQQDIQAFARSLEQPPECCNVIRRFNAGVCVCEAGLLTLSRIPAISTVFRAFEAANCSIHNFYVPANCAVQF
jgi:hypothetical protein